MGRLRDRLLSLDVVRDDDAGHRSLRLGDPHRAVDGVPHLRRIGDEDGVLGGHVLEQGDQVDLLLVGAPQALLILLADDRHHRLVHWGGPRAMNAAFSPGRAWTNGIVSWCRCGPPGGGWMPPRV